MNKRSMNKGEPAASAGRGNVLRRMFGCELREATEKQVVPCAVRERSAELLEERQPRISGEQTRAKRERKQVYYMSMEFLVGT